MIFTIENVARSLADYLAPVLPGAAFYAGPNQQGSAAPCMFLQQRYSRIRKRQAGRWLRTIGLDLTYLEDYNLPNMQQLYEAAAEALDQVLETFPYSDGGPSTLLRTYDREWKIDQDALHYKFVLKVWVNFPENDAMMQTLDLKQEVMNGKKIYPPGADRPGGKEVHPGGADARRAFLYLSARLPSGSPD